MRCGFGSRRISVHDETDETIIRIAAALRPLPEVDPAQKARVLVAVAAERERARERRVRVARGWRFAGGGAFVAAAGLAAAVWLQTPQRQAQVTTAVRDTAAAFSAAAATSARAVDARLAVYKSVQVVL